MSMHHSILGVCKGATKAEICKAYRSKALQLHPDNFVDADEKKAAEENMKVLNGAKDDLLKSAPTNRPTNFLFVGNPGVGKSVILNGLVKKIVFKSGVSYGGGLTFQFDQHVEGDYTYMERKQASEAITAALSKGGYFKIFFVVTLEAGRLRPQDKTTIELVLASAPISSYGLIINKVSKRMQADLLQNPRKLDPTPQQMLLTELWNGAANPTSHIMINPKDDDLEDADDQVPALPDALMSFIEGLPTTYIRKEDVSDIKDSQFEDLTKMFEEKFAEMKADNELMRKEMREKDALMQAFQHDIAAALQEAAERAREAAEATEKKQANWKRREHVVPVLRVVGAQ